jgi:hypothetical protein
VTPIFGGGDIHEVRKSVISLDPVLVIYLEDTAAEEILCHEAMDELAIPLAVPAECYQQVSR